MSRFEVAAWVVLVAGAFTLRVAYVDFGLPALYHPDERLASQVVVGFCHGDFVLHRYNHPPLLKLIAFAGVWLANLVAPASDPEALSLRVLLALRWVSVVAGTATVVCLYALARRFCGVPLAFAAAALYAVLPAAVFMSKYGTPDTLLTFFVTAGLAVGVTLPDRPTRSRYAACGALLGLAIAAKYNGALLAPAFLVAHVAAVRSGRVRPFAGAQLGWFALGALVALAVGFLSIPLDAAALARSLAYELRHHYVTGHDGVRVWARQIQQTHFVSSILPSAGPLLALAMLAGLGALVVRARAAGLVVLAALLPYALAIEWTFTVPVNPERYVLPILPCYVAAAVALAAVGIERLRVPAGRAAAAAAVAVVLGAVPAVRVAHHLPELARDTRDTMREWMDANLPRDALVYLPRGPGSYYPELGNSAFRVKPRIDRRGLQSGAFVLASSFVYDRYADAPRARPRAAALYEGLFQRGDLVHEESAAHGSFLFHNPTLRLYAVPEGE